jgi:serine protease Do
MRVAVVVLWAIAMCSPLSAQNSRSEQFRNAEQAFNQVSVETRLQLQVLLTGAGYWAAVPNVSFSRRLNEAILQFQNENGFAPTGALDDVQFRRLQDRAMPMFNLWGFRAVSHPQKGKILWVPFGFGLAPVRDKWGLAWEEPRSRVKVAYSQLQNASHAGLYEKLLTGIRNENGIIHYKTIKNDFFAISSSSATGIDSYTRFHRDGNDLLGFSLWWRNSETQLHVERVATLMSGSFWSSMTGAPFPAIPATARQPESAAARPAVKPEQEPVAPPSDAKRSSSSGTGFFVTVEGHVLTNAHVVDRCTSIEVTADKGALASGRLLVRDSTNDLALIKLDQKPPKTLAFKTGIRLGEPVAAFGFPLASLLASSGNFTLGNVTALAGIGDDSRFLQVSAPVQPGNSGGPLLDQSGNLVGVVTGKLNASKMMIVTNGDIPQNVNFAIKASVATNFLESNRIALQTGTADQPMASADLADHARLASVFITCRQ